MSESANGVCQKYCVCVRFVLPKESTKQLKKEITDKVFEKELKKELKKTKAKVDCEIKWMEHSEKKEEKGKSLFALSLIASNEHFGDEEFYKCFPILQKRMDYLKQYGVKDFETTTCSDFNFELKRFKPVGELILPAKLPLRPELVDKLGEPKLSAFGIEFEKSPLGLNAVALSVNREENVLSISLVSAFQTLLENIIENAFIHGKKISNLFVEERK